MDRLWGYYMINTSPLIAHSSKNDAPSRRTLQISDSFILHMSRKGARPNWYVTKLDAWVEKPPKPPAEERRGCECEQERKPHDENAGYNKLGAW